MIKTIIVTQEEFEASIKDDHQRERGEYRFLSVQPRLKEDWGGLWLEIRDEKIEEVNELDSVIDDNLFRLRRYDSLNGLNFPGFLKKDVSACLLNIYYASDRIYYGYANIYRKIKELAEYLKDCRFFICEDYSEWLDEYCIVDGKLHFTREEYQSDEDLYHRFFLEKAQRTKDDADLAYAVATKLIFSKQYDLKRARINKDNDPDKRDIKDVTTALELCPNHEQAWLVHGVILLNEEKVDQAQNAFEQVLAITPLSAEALIGLGLIALMRQKHHQALTYFSHAQKILPQEKTLWLLQLFCHSKLQEHHHSHDDIDKLCQPMTDGTYSLTILTMINAASLLAEMLQQLLPELQAYIKKNPQAVGQLSLEINAFSKVFTWFGTVKNDLKPLLSWLVEIDEQNSDTAYEFAKLTTDKTQKQILLKKVIENNPKQQDALKELATSYYQDQRYDDAMPYLEKYLAIVNSGYFLKQYQRMLFNCYYQKANQLEAAKTDLVQADSYYEKSMVLSALVPELANFEGPWVGRGHIAHIMGDYAKAITYYDIALEKNEKSPHAWSAKAVSLADLQQYEQALNCCTKALEYDANYWHGYYCKAYILALKKNVDSQNDIIGLLEKTAKLYPNLAEVIVGDKAFTWLNDDKAFKSLFGH